MIWNISSHSLWVPLPLQTNCVTVVQYLIYNSECLGIVFFFLALPCREISPLSKILLAEVGLVTLTINKENTEPNVLSLQLINLSVFNSHWSNKYIALPKRTKHTSQAKTEAYFLILSLLFPSVPPFNNNIQNDPDIVGRYLGKKILVAR